MSVGQDQVAAVCALDARQPGVTIIIPAFRAGDHLFRALQSVVEQTIDHRLIEVVVIENGPDSSVVPTIEEIQQNPAAADIDWKWFRSEAPGAARARNVGLAASTRQFITFLDDDDWLEPEYLLRLMNVADDSTIAVTGILNQTAAQTAQTNTLHDRAKALPNRRMEISSAPWVLGFVASKLVPWNLVRNIAFPEDLDSGEDVVFFGRVLSRPEVYVQPVNDFTDASYCRSLGETSVSRGRADFKFSVSERLQVMRLLNESEIVNPDYAAARTTLIRSQARFIRDFYDRSAPAVQEQILDEVTHFAIQAFPWEDFERGRPNKLVFAYCFPPDADASSNVMAKRIMSAEQMVDVISNDMSSVRSQDQEFYAVVKRWINRHTVIEVPTSFANWHAISRWAAEAVEASENSNANYKEIYSRALWVASHVAGCLYKLNHPEVRWIAEFSDPLAFGVDGSLRPGEIGDDQTARQLLSILPETEKGSPRTLFQVVEEASLRLADEVIFTNQSQMNVILGSYCNEFRDEVIQKSVVSPQPVPPNFLYDIRRGSYFQADKINVAYFGAFYPNRGVDGVVKALMRLEESVRSRLQLTIFTNSEVPHPLINEVVVRPQLSYLDFLTASKEADVLLVTDTSTVGCFNENPFLPSKVADYLGSGSQIWGIVEQGSPLSQLDLDFVSTESVDDIVATLQAIVLDSETAK